MRLDEFNFSPADQGVPDTQVGRKSMPMATFAQKSRRYLGNKHKLTPLIRSIVKANFPNYQSIADVFAGTGVVGAAFNGVNTRIISNDLLQSNYVCLFAFLGFHTGLSIKIWEMLDYLNHLVPEKENYFSRNFGNRYFSLDNARKIGTVRAEIDRIASNDIEKKILLCSLVYATDKVANTVGHYDAYRKHMDMSQSLVLRPPNLNVQKNVGNEIYCEDANLLSRRVDCDVLYIDPPYNSRQYSDAYHLLENLVVWNKPEVKGLARKMDRTHIKSKYCVKGASETLSDLIQHASCRNILLSYNNTGNSMNGRSNARITDEEITDTLADKGNIKIYSGRHKAFTTRKLVTDDNTERIFYCRVRGSA